ncbi:MAG: hypothetical protein WD042_10310 [Phycisphaeraceae bacterium]
MKRRRLAQGRDRVRRYSRWGRRRRGRQGHAIMLALSAAKMFNRL